MLVRRTTRSVALVAVLTTVLSLIGVGPAHAAAACSEDQQSLEDGPTTVTAHGTTHFANASSNEGDLGGGQLTYNLKGVITPPNETSSDGSTITGFLTYSIDWDDNSLGTTTFTTDCVLGVETRFKHIAAIYFGAMQNPPVDPCGGGGGLVCTPDRTEGSSGSGPAVSFLELDRVSPRRADLHLEAWFAPTCFPAGSGFVIERDNAQALGDKTGNGARIISNCD